MNSPIPRTVVGVDVSIACISACAVRRRPFVIGVLQPMLLPPPSAPTATGWSDSCRAGFAPAEDWRLLPALACKIAPICLIPST